MVVRYCDVIIWSAIALVVYIILISFFTAYSVTRPVHALANMARIVMRGAVKDEFLKGKKLMTLKLIMIPVN